MILRMLVCFALGSLLSVMLVVLVPAIVARVRAMAARYYVEPTDMEE